MKCDKCDHPKLDLIPENIYVLVCPKCQNLQVKGKENE